MDKGEGQTCAGVALDHEIYLFADQADAELKRLRAENAELKEKYLLLLDRCVDLTIKCDQLNAALDRAITVMANMEKHHGILAQKNQAAAH